MSRENPSDFTIQSWLKDINDNLVAINGTLERIAHKLEYPKRRTTANTYETLYRMSDSVRDALAISKGVSPVRVPTDFIREGLDPLTEYEQDEG